MALLMGLLASLAWAPVAAQPPPSNVTWVCDAVYLPARTAWARSVTIAYDQQRVRSVAIDGVPVYTFAIYETVILTALDNERIQIDTASRTWTSDFRGMATAQGRCE
jgi:hypothetical protein